MIRWLGLAILFELCLIGCGKRADRTAETARAPAHSEAALPGAADDRMMNRATRTEEAQPQPDNRTRAPVVAASSQVPEEVAWIGVNLASGSFGSAPGVYGRQYVYPGPEDFDYCRAKGLNPVRLPFRWERVQRTLMGPLDETEMRRLDEVVTLARQREIKLILDLHNYARYGGNVIGSPKVPVQAFTDFWLKLAEHYRDEPAVLAYGLMNEPHGTNGIWPDAAQAAVDAIRSVDRRHTIMVSGDEYGGAHSWKRVNQDLLLHDPANNLVYEAHQYFDRDFSGQYAQSYDDSDAHPNIGVERLRPFAEWLKEHHVRGFLGEFGVPGDDPRWLEVLDNFIAALKAEGIGGTYWAGGPRWGSYPLSVEPREGEDRPQMEVLELYAGGRQMPPDAKPSYADAFARGLKAAPSAVAPAKTLPPGTEKLVFDCGVKKESYHFKNEASEYSSAFVEDNGRRARKITYQHVAPSAHVGVGLYFGALDCSGYSAFRLAVRASQPCKLRVAAFHSNTAVHAGSFQVGTAWQDLTIPFDALKRDNESFDPARRLVKISFEPGRVAGGNSIYLAQFKLLAQ